MIKPLILIIEDEKDVADLVAQTIRETDRYDTITAYSAKEGLKILRKNKVLFGFGGNKVKLIVLDIKMPEMDGLEFLEKVRQKYGYDIGVVMLTAWEDEEKWERATSGYVIGYIKKPFKKDRLIRTLDRFFEGSMTEMQLETFVEHLDKKEEFRKSA